MHACAFYAPITKYSRPLSCPLFSFMEIDFFYFFLFIILLLFQPKHFKSQISQYNFMWISQHTNNETVQRQTFILQLSAEFDKLGKDKGDSSLEIT